MSDNRVPGKVAASAQYRAMAVNFEAYFDSARAEAARLAAQQVEDEKTSSERPIQEDNNKKRHARHLASR